MRRVLLLLLLLPTAALAQWPTTEWHVVCTDATHASIEQDFLDGGFSAAEARAATDRECDDTVTAPASAAALARIDLERSSVWYSEMGFRVPVVDVAPDGRYLAYLADELLSDPTSLGEYDYTTGKMVMKSTFYIEVRASGGSSGGTPRREPPPYEPSCEPPRPGGGSGGGGEAVYTGVDTVVHELYHAIQASYASSRDADSWIAEGMAEGATLAWIRQTRGIRAGYGSPFLSHSLHIPEGRTADDRYGAGYWRANFWYIVGEMVDPGRYIGYTETLLQENLHTGRGVGGVQTGLTHWHDDGMYHFYPRFIAEAGEARRLYAQSGCSALDIPFGGGTVEREMPATVKPIAAHHHRIVVSGVLEEEAYGIVVEIEEDHEDLHLAVGPLLFNEAAEGTRRNRFQTVIIGDGDADTLSVRVANIAPDPTRSRERSYTLNVRVSRVEPCSEYALVAALNPTGREMRQNVQMAAAYRRYVREEVDTREVIYPLGTGDMSLAGDAGSVCVSHFAASDLEWSAERDPDFDYEGEQEAVIARNMPGAMEATGLSEAQIRGIIEGTSSGGASPAQIMALMDYVRDVASQPLVDTPDQSGVLFHVFAPNLIPALVGGIAPEILSSEDAVITRHGGVGGWTKNSAANLIVYLPGTTAADIESGGTYAAMAYARSHRDDTAPPDGPETKTALHTMWDGAWKTIRCRGSLRDRFIGTQTTVWGRLTGSVTIESVTPASVEGSFSLSGSGEAETITTELVRHTPFRADCPYSVEESEDWSTSGVSASGTFHAPNFRGPGTVMVAGGSGRAVPVGR